MLIRQTLKLDLVELKADPETGSFEGYAARFGSDPAKSDGIAIKAGAFSYTLRQNGKPKMFFAHDWSMPIGKYPSAKEDDNGLKVRGEFTPKLTVAQDVRAAMLHETLDGLSIGGFIAREDAEELDGGGMLIHRFTRLIEVSPCVFPADERARVDLATVRSADLEELLGELETIRDFERLLRDAGGFSKGQATALTARAAALFGKQGEPAETKQAEASVRALDDRISRLASIGA